MEGGEEGIDLEALEKAELNRIEERMSLRHKNTSRQEPGAGPGMLRYGPVWVWQSPCPNAQGGDSSLLLLTAAAAAAVWLPLGHCRWARRALGRGIPSLDEGTKQAIGEQLRLGEQLREKIDKIDRKVGPLPSPALLPLAQTAAMWGPAPPVLPPPLISVTSKPPSDRCPFFSSPPLAGERFGRKR